MERVSIILFFIIMIVADACSAYNACSLHGDSVGNYKEINEDNFEDYENYILKQPDSIAVAHAFNILLDNISGNEDALDATVRLAQKRFANNESKFRNDDLWLTFLDVLRKRENLEEAMKMRYDFEHFMASLNRPGTLANDFEYELRNDSSKRNLYSTVTGSQGLILIFYNPECNQCHEIIENLSKNNELNTLIEKKDIEVVVIDPEDDYEAWRITCDSLPASWTVGYNTDGIIENDAYELLSYPVFYILDQQYKVIGKNIYYSDLLTYISKVAER